MYTPEELEIATKLIEQHPSPNLLYAIADAFFARAQQQENPDRFMLLDRVTFHLEKAAGFAYAVDNFSSGANSETVAEARKAWNL